MYHARRLVTRSFWTENLSTDYADFLLIWVSLGVGVVDAFTFPFLRVFTANMTGNLVFLALAAAQVDDPQLSAGRSMVALAAFWAGSFVSGQTGHRVGVRKRWWVTLTFALQGLCVLAGAITIWTNGISNQDILALNHRVLGLITLLSFAYGAQGTTARGLGVAEVPTVVVTSAMIDFFGDKNLFKTHNLGRNRRAAFTISLFIGGLIGGGIVSRVNGALTIAMAAVIKFITLIFVVFCIGPAEDETLKQASYQTTAEAREPRSVLI